MSDRRRRRGRHVRRTVGSVLRPVAVTFGLAALGVLIGAAGVLVYDEVAADDDAVVTGAPVTTTTTVPPAPAVLAPSPGTVRLAFFGDSYAERELEARLADDPVGFVGPFADLLASVDLAIGNLETAITERGAAADKEFTFRAPPTLLDALAAAGVDVVSMANNHAIDFGLDGLADSLAARAATEQPAIIGIGVDEDDAYAPEIRIVGGVRIAVLAATQVLDAGSIGRWTATVDQPGVASAKRADRLAAAVEAAAETADTVVVYLHFGIETEQCPSASQLELVRLLTEAGADVVVGSHAHRVQGGGWRGGAVVHYGLGNFLFSGDADDARETGVFLVDLDPTGAPVGLQWVPGRITAAVPEPLDGADAAEALADWERRRSCTDLDAAPTP